MPIVERLCKAAKSIIVWGAKTNRENRAEIRKIVLTLASELERGVSLVIAYLEGAQGIDDDKQLGDYVRNIRKKVLKACNEFRVCSTLYDLCDRFESVFDTTKASITIGRRTELEALLHSIRDRER